MFNMSVIVVIIIRMVLVVNSYGVDSEIVVVCDIVLRFVRLSEMGNKVVGMCVSRLFVFLIERVIVFVVFFCLLKCL